MSRHRPKPYWVSKDGGHRIYCADCLDVLPFLKADVVVTDPPYGVGFIYESHNDTRDGYEDWCRKWFKQLRKTSPAILMSCGAINVPMWANIEPFKWQIAWLKPAAMGRSPVGFCNWEPMPFWGKTKQSGSVDVFKACIIPNDSLDGHPCPKPVEWGVKSVLCVSVKGQIILDPFMGIGTVGVACVRTGRKFIGVEIEEKYCQIAAKRMESELEREETTLFKASDVKQVVEEEPLWS